MTNRLIGSLLAIALLVFNQFTSAEDIDLFVQPAPTSTDPPNVLIILDNTANWNSPFTNEMAALVSTLDALPVNADGSAKFRVGLMLFTETGNPNKGDDGGYVRAAVRPLSTSPNNKQKYHDLLASLDKIADRSNGGKLAKTMWEAYQYYAGKAPNSGNQKVKTDYAGNPSGTTQSNAIYKLPGNALSSMNGSPYISPVGSGSCARNYIIFISNGATQDPSSDTTAAYNALSSAGGNITPIPITPSGKDNEADEWARFMKTSPLGVTTYTVEPVASNSQPAAWTALLKSMAGVSGGKYFDVTADPSSTNIAIALGDIFSEIQATNSVFASVALPVSVNSQDIFSNQIFIGLFRPDASAFPRWAGNLKQYKLALISNVLSLVDADGKDAINNNKGFITECARSYWTPTITDNYWSSPLTPQGGCLTIANADSSNYPDGKIVEKGAQAYKLRSTTTRTVNTCSPASCTALITFNSTAATQALLGAASTAERDELINWEKGLDVDDENINAVTLTEMRSSAHGDVIHSRPVAVNFGTDSAPQVAVFYGGNDGILRAINGNRDGGLSIGGKAPGMELWAFVAPEFYSAVKRLRDDTTPISFKGSTITGALPKPYGVDGPITAYKDASSTWIYAPMRRGGRALYAFSVANTAPESPTLTFKRSYTDTGFSGMGQTWSSAKTLKASGYGGGTSPLLIMGGGYDTCEDADPYNPSICASTMGNHVYVLAATGATSTAGTLLKTLDTDRPVTGDVFVLSDTSTGLANWAYVADLGGNIYRISGINANTPFASTAPGSWTITKIASLGGSGTDARKFLFAPDIVDNKDGSFSLLIGSGDREKPLKDFTSAYAVQNYFFMVKDRPTDSGWLTSACGSGNNVICLGSLGQFSFVCPTDLTQTASSFVTGTPTAKGWALQLCSHEQAVTSGITVYGITTFDTHIPVAPDANACTSNLGTARAYNVDYLNPAIGGTSPFTVVVGGGLSPSPVAGQVKLDNGQTVPFVIGGGATPFTPRSPPPPFTAMRPKGRVYWFIQQ